MASNSAISQAVRTVAPARDDAYGSEVKFVNGVAVIDSSTIEEAVRTLLDAAPSGSEVILFGSYARGTARDDSDLDFLVVEPALRSRRAEMVRLRQTLRPLRIPVDVLVVSRAVFEAWKDLPNNVIHQAAREGKVFTRAA
ncbi:MAG: nucleotidyltransferase domain-containing protein [Phycisphaerales bacterium]|nr:MAG: nucleotidyltransferase domain-containing protein [Phycisphaerales bacterium]